MNFELLEMHKDRRLSCAVPGAVHKTNETYFSSPKGELYALKLNNSLCYIQHLPHTLALKDVS